MPTHAVPVLRRLSVRRLTVLAGLLRSESAGGYALIASAVLALAWSNSSAGPVLDSLLQLPIGIQVGETTFREELHLWINDGLMAAFFLLVGLELRREMLTGELASVQRVALPGLAALGGMVVPALIYAALNRHDPFALRGWAVPVATDIAFALAVVSVLGRRVPIGLKVFLTALAVMDDLGAIVVIALFYTNTLDVLALGAAVVLWLVLWAMGRAGVRKRVPYLLGGLLLWALVFRSGVHATLAGVALAFAIPMQDAPEAVVGEASPALRLEHALVPWVFYLVLPLFGLANAGLPFSEIRAGMLLDTVPLGILLGLFLGKQLGVFSAAWLAIRLRFAPMPAGVTLRQLYGGAILCGIGFTMSLFINDLAFRGQVRGEASKLSVFAGSLLSAVVGLAWLALAGRTRGAPQHDVAAAELAAASAHEAALPGRAPVLTRSAE